MTPPAITAEEAIEQYERLRAKNEAKEHEPIWIERSVKAPGSAQYCMHELKFTTAIPADEKTSQRIRDLKKLWDSECQDFEKQHVRPQNGSQSPAKPPLIPYGINQIEWYPNKFPENIPAEKRGEYSFTDRPECAELRKVLENTAKPVEIQGQVYWLNPARTYVYRRAANTEAPEK